MPTTSLTPPGPVQLQLPGIDRKPPLLGEIGKWKPSPDPAQYAGRPQNFDEAGQAYALMVGDSDPRPLGNVTFDQAVKSAQAISKRNSNFPVTIVKDPKEGYWAMEAFTEFLRPDLRETYDTGLTPRPTPNATQLAINVSRTDPRFEALVDATTVADVRSGSAQIEH